MTRRNRRAALLAATTSDLLDQTSALASELAALDAAGLYRLARSHADHLATLEAEVTATAASTTDPSAADALTSLGEDIGTTHRAIDAIALDPAPPTDDTVAAVHQQAASLHTLTAHIRATHFSTDDA